ncbi:MAG: hypothetical protein MJ180_05590, partial [Candidatus Gastranaerophilales bacterium]|nr:hypothetical protein [Candidatus Gastranaerophilales bacterium]
MEIAEKLESIENKIENYNEKIDNISSLITTLIHSFEKTQLSKVKSEIIAKIEEKLSDNSSFPDVEEMKSVFSQIKDDFAESQSALKLKIVELEKTIKKISTTVSDVNKTEIDSVDASQLSNIEEILKSLSDKINNFNIAADA